ncbi:Chromatin modification-related protein EAF1 [Neonectria ditissima]|uniref:Vacuolar import and degradation protein 21 n=1 Tax=Neonectria ditissima TaxID=78410 RepID=A0A0P7AJK9_9HYPO|nr:Chromatin modification-related protein EAF1 [Neonectria ditissima]
MLMASSSIVTSRKRKLRELFAVATQVESLPHPVLANPDAPTTTPAEWQFLQANDIFQGKILNESNIPPRPTLSIEALKKSLAKSVTNATESSPPAALEEGRKDVIPKSQDGTPANKTTSAIKPSIGNAAHIAPTPKISPKPTPTVYAPHAPLQPAPIAPPTHGLVKPATTPRPVTPVPTDTSKNQSPNQKDTAAGSGHAAPQVALPSVVKASPPADPKTERPIPEANAAITARPGSLSIKPPVEGPRAPDALSSPGSTAQSATTPAVHDASANTSPENEGPQYTEPGEQKLEPDVDAREVEAPRTVEAPVQEDLRTRALNAPPDSAEAQLLQESIRSSAVVTSPLIEPRPTAPVTVGEDIVTEETGVKISPVAEPKVDKTSPSDETRAKPDDGIVDTRSPEIPDSQDEVADQMEIDGPEPSKSRQTQTEPAFKKESPPADAPSTPVPTEAAVREVSQVSERAVTRVSSGAMRLKSVSEIVGATPRPTPTLDRTATSQSFDNQLTPLTSTPQSPSIRHRNAATHRRERSKSQPSTVLFGKQSKRMDEKSMLSNQRDTVRPTDDYYTPLFVQGFAGSSSWMQPIEKILFTANKTVATPDANLAIQDHQACKVLRRVYHLQQHDKWSLRQPKRCPEPTRPPTQWDVMLQEMKWMRTDFREERKWKRAVAKNLAYACADWHEATPSERKALQISAIIPPRPQPTVDVSMADTDQDGAENQPTPDLVSGDMDSPDNMDELTDDFMQTVAPSAIFALQDDDVIFGLRRTPTADQLLEELPMYGPPLMVPKFDLTGPEYDPDAHWRRPALPLSKYVEGQMKLVSDGPPRKRSRYDYRNEDSEDENESIFAGNQKSSNMNLPAQTDEVALFNPEMRHIRDRLHAGHQFRPPSEHPMPTQSFYECRSSSQWTMTEDDELRCLVREHTYNWSLISSILTTKSLFTSGAERRTPWECFERWINLEGLPSDMQKTQYFKAYNSRIEAAQRVIMQQNQLAAQQANSAGGGAVTPVRRRHSTPLRVERRRNQKHLTLIDAMRKLAKKRETTIQKQQHTASQNAANKKTNDPVSQRPTKTPRDYSLLRWERDQALAEKMAQYAQRQEAQRRAALQARAQGQAAQMAGNPGAQAGQNNAHAAAAAVAAAANGMNGAGRVNVPNQLAAAAAAGQGRPRMPMQSPVNGMGGVPSHMAGGLVPPSQMNGVPQVQMQAAMQGQHNRMPMPNPQPDVNLMMRAQRISEQQRAAVQMQQAQQGPGTPVPAATQQSPPPNMRNGVNGVNGVNSVNGVNGIGQQSFINNAQAMMASFNANNNNHSTPPANGLQAPRPQTQLPASIANQLAQLEGQFRAKNPNLTTEQLRQLSTEHLTRAMMAQRQSAMNHSAMSAAAGANGQPGGLPGSIAATTSPHQYAALLRQQQQQQANQAAGSPAQHQRQASGSATPSIGK